MNQKEEPHSANMYQGSDPSRGGGGGGVECYNRLSRDKALIKRDPVSLIIQTARAARLINGMDLDNTDPQSAPIK